MEMEVDMVNPQSKKGSINGYVPNNYVGRNYLLKISKILKINMISQNVLI